MNCNFSSCEFYNVVFGGVITGVIASACFVWLKNVIEVWEFQKKYKYLNSISPDKYDWIAFSMQKENGRVREDNPNGSVVNISIRKNRICLILKHDERKWEGELLMDRFGFGIVTYKYVGQHEYGKRDCVIGSFVENEKTYDYLFMTPTNNRIFNIKKTENDCMLVEYNYGDEIFIRERLTR